MADFVETEQPCEEAGLKSVPSEVNMDPVTVVYCPICSMPPEYCEYGPSFDRCLPWIRENAPDALAPEYLASLLKKMGLEEGDGTAETEDDTDDKKKKKRSGGIAGPKKKAGAAVETRVVIAKIQRQKRKFVTAVAGLESVPGLKIKDAAKLFGKKFSSGASVQESASGAKEVVIQGDVEYDLPQLLIDEFKVPPTAIFFVEDKTLRPYA